MKLNCIGCDFRFDLQAISLLFFPNTKFADASDGRELTVTLNDSFAEAEFVSENGKFRAAADVNTELYDAERAACKRAAFTLFSDMTGIRPEWGLLTGIRPAVLYEKIKRIHGVDAPRIMKEEYLVSEDKFELCQDVCECRKPCVSIIDKGDACLYISIPFCPSRCKYCSFVSYTTENEHNFIPQYLNTLIEELPKKKEMSEADGCVIKAIYIGGGTPTVLSADELELLLEKINEVFDMSRIIEFTVEAGRPDTITADKLCVMKKWGVGRISVNPQTLNDDVLRIVGRKHTTEQFFEVFEIAKEMGFDINVDLIAGLPTETADGFCEGLKRITALRPANLTIHTLYIKRAADYGMAHGMDLSSSEHAKEVSEMLHRARKMCADADLLPYYMYRQKNTVGNNENIGYAVKGKECIYNVWMMDDLVNVYGCGAGAMTKQIERSEDGMQAVVCRTANTKFAYNYIKDGK